MKRKAPSAATAPAPIYAFQVSDEEFHRRNMEWLDNFRTLSQRKKRELLIKLGVLTPEGNLPVYPMDDHVPYRPW